MPIPFSQYTKTKGGNASLQTKVTPVPFSQYQAKKNVNQRQSFRGLSDVLSTGVGDSTPKGNTSTDTVGLIKNIVGGVISAPVGLGSMIAAGSNQGQAIQKQLLALPKSDQDYLSTLFTLRNQYKTRGQDTSHYDTLIKNYKSSKGTSITDAFPVLKESSEQDWGNILGTALDVITAGAGGEASVAEKGLSTGARVLEGAKTGAAAGAGFGLAGGMQGNENTTDLLKSTAIGAVAGGVTGGATDGLFGKRPVTPEIQTIQDTIAPALDKKETAAALSEGRIKRGETTFTGKKLPDVVTHSKDTIQASQTIYKYIPNASKMSDVELHGALDQKVSQMAQSLQKDMSSVPIPPKTLGVIRDAWGTLKSSQLKDDEFLDFKAGNTQFQKNFETRLNTLNRDITDSSGKFKAPTPQTLDQLWDARKSFDSSIPDRVKNATDNSPANLQYRKKMWLDDRAILNSAINDTETGLGKTSAQAFSDMSDMYDAQSNISSKVKVDTKGNPTTNIGKYFNKHPVQKHVIRGVGGAMLGGTVGKVLGGTAGEIVGGAAGAGLGGFTE